MPIRVDPEGNETLALFGLTDFNGQHVLEIGSGDGRLTWHGSGDCHTRKNHIALLKPIN